jgi:uncharacterized protein
MTPGDIGGSATVDDNDLDPAEGLDPADNDPAGHDTTAGESAQHEIVMEHLDEETCWRFLARTGFGRIGFVRDDEVTILPVNVTVAERRIVFRTAEGTSLAAAGHGSVVAFEADDTDRVSESGWSILVRGTLWDVTDRPETSRWNEFLVRPWAPPPRDVWMVIEPSGITGRTVRRRRNLPRVVGPDDHELRT